MIQLSAVIITKNEARNIGRCLASLEGVVDEIVVADTHSEDDTHAICKAFGARLELMEWEGYAVTKNKANQLAKGDFILSIDADEALSAELKKTILEERQQLNGAISFNRLNNYCGKWIRHGGYYPDRKTRIFPRDKATWKGDYVHEYLVIDPGLRVKHIGGDLLHYSYYSIKEHVQRADKYAELASAGMIAKGINKPFFKMIFSPQWKFIKSYMLKAGFLDGWEGLCLSVISAFEVFLKYAKVVIRDSEDNISSR
jgi:(heptosyl)LPS beta-1,4-glucosyltransferase